jgi:hypothetical protein
MIIVFRTSMSSGAVCVLESKCLCVPVIQGGDILDWSGCAGVSLRKGLRNGQISQGLDYSEINIVVCCCNMIWNSSLLGCVYNTIIG